MTPFTVSESRPSTVRSQLALGTVPQRRRNRRMPYAGPPIDLTLVTAGLAHVLGAAPAGSGDASDAMVRAVNLANLLTKGLAATPGAERKRELEQIGGGAWTAAVLALAKQAGGPMGLVDAVRFSLAMHFLIGILQSRAGEKSIYTNAYRVASEETKAALVRHGANVAGHGANVAGIGVVGLAGLGVVTAAQMTDSKYTKCYTFSTDANRADRAKQVRRTFKQALGRDPSDAEVLQWASSRWCSDATLIGKIKGTKGAPRPDDLGARPGIFDRAANAVGEAFDVGEDLLCKGFVSLLGPKFGGLLCTVLKFVLSLVRNNVQALIAAVGQIVDGLVDFVKALARGDTGGAINALLRDVMGALFVVPPMGGLLATFIYGPDDKNAVTKLVGLGKKVYDKDKLFIVKLAASVAGVLSPPTSPTAARNTVISLVNVLRPAIVVLLAETIVQYAQKLGRDAVEAAVDKLVSIVIAIMLGVFAVEDFVKDIGERVDKAGGWEKFIGQQIDALGDKFKVAWSACVADPQRCTLDKVFKDELDGIVKAIASFHLPEIIASMKDFVVILTGVPAKAPTLPGVPAPAQYDSIVAALPRLSPIQRAQVISTVLKSVKPAEQGPFLTALQQQGVT